MIGQGDKMLLPRPLIEDMRNANFRWDQAPYLPTKGDAIFPCLLEFDGAWSSMQGHSYEADILW